MLFQLRSIGQFVRALPSASTSGRETINDWGPTGWGVGCTFYPECVRVWGGPESCYHGVDSLRMNEGAIGAHEETYVGSKGFGRATQPSGHVVDLAFIPETRDPVDFGPVTKWLVDLFRNGCSDDFIKLLRPSKALGDPLQNGPTPDFSKLLRRKPGGTQACNDECNGLLARYHEAVPRLSKTASRWRA